MRRAFLGEGHCLLSDWEARVHQLLDADSPAATIGELMACLLFATTDEQLAALDDVIGCYRTNRKRMCYRSFRARGLPVGSGIVESAHRHVLHVRKKRAGQRWSLLRARRMVRLRAAHRTAGPICFHRAIRDGLPPAHDASPELPFPNAPRRLQRSSPLHLGSPINTARLASL